MITQQMVLLILAAREHLERIFSESSRWLLMQMTAADISCWLAGELAIDSKIPIFPNANTIAPILSLARYRHDQLGLKERTWIEIPNLVQQLILRPRVTVEGNKLIIAPVGQEIMLGGQTPTFEIYKVEDEAALSDILDETTSLNYSAQPGHYAVCEVYPQMGLRSAPSEVVTVG